MVEPLWEGTLDDVYVVKILDDHEHNGGSLHLQIYKEDKLILDEHHNWIHEPRFGIDIEDLANMQKKGSRFYR